MTTHTITFRALLFLGSLFTFGACDDHPVEPGDHPLRIWSQADMVGSYKGTVQAAGGLSSAGEANMTIQRSEDGIFGGLQVDAQFGVGEGAMLVAFQSTYTGTVRQYADPNVVLSVENPDCGGTTAMTGMYSPAESSLELEGSYVHRNPDGCEEVATIKLAISVHKSN